MSRRVSAVDYFRMKGKVTLVGSDGECTRPCSECPLAAVNNGAGLPCRVFEMKYPRRAVGLVEAWFRKCEGKVGSV